MAGAEHLLDRMVTNVEHGRFERSLSGLTAVAALVTGAEVYLEHYKASFGNKWMWTPVALTPPLVAAGIGGVFSKRWAKTALPVTAAAYAANGLLGEYFHARGVARKPGGWKLYSYNLPMGPPISAPGLMAMVGGMGLLAARATPGAAEPCPTSSRPDHLPNRRPGEQPPHPSWLPRHRRGTTPQMIGRYPDFDVLDAAGTWDGATKKVVLARLEPPGPLRFFTTDEEPALRALCDTVLAQDREPRVPVAEMVDAKLADGRLDGYQYADMPDDRDTWRLVLRGLDHTATRGYQTSFTGATEAQREAIVSRVRPGPAGRRGVG